MIDPVTLLVAAIIGVVLLILVLIFAPDVIGIALTIGGILLFIGALTFGFQLLSPEGRTKAGKQFEDLINTVNGWVQSADKQVKLTDRLDKLSKLQEAAEKAAAAAKDPATALELNMEGRRKAESAYRDAKRLGAAPALLDELARAYLRADDAVTNARKDLEKSVNELSTRQDEFNKAVTTVETEHKRAIDGSERLKNQVAAARKAANAIDDVLADCRGKCTAAGAGLRETAAGDLQAVAGQINGAEAQKELARLIEESALKRARTVLDRP